MSRGSNRLLSYYGSRILPLRHPARILYIGLLTENPADYLNALIKCYYKNAPRVGCPQQIHVF